MTRKERAWLDGYERAARWWGPPIIQGRSVAEWYPQPVFIDMAISHCLENAAKHPPEYAKGYVSGLLTAWGV